MNIKKLFSLIIIIALALTLVGCTKNEGEDLWKTYVDAVNNKDLLAVASTFYSNAKDIDNFKNSNSNYFDIIQKIKSKEVTTKIDCDFSRGTNAQAYYLLEVEAQMDINGEVSDKTFPVYIYTNEKGTFFCSEFNFVDDDNLGNKSNEAWEKTVYYTNEDFQYKLDEKNNTILLSNVSNPKELEIPTEIDGKVVTTIMPYCFYKYTKILCFTFPKSKLTSVTIPETIKSIEKNAFFQCTKLKEISIPKSVVSIQDLAFAGCTGVKKVSILSETLSVEKKVCESTSVGGGDQPLVILNAHDMQVGDIVKLSILRYDNEETIRSVKWTSSSDVISVNSDTGEITAKSTGSAKITVSLKDNPLVYATVTITVSEVEKVILISNDAFNRCNSLESLYIYATNPNSISIVNGTKFNLNDEVKIYVPIGSKQMYINQEQWSDYAKQIYEIGE